MASLNEQIEIVGGLLRLRRAGVLAEVDCYRRLLWVRWPGKAKRQRIQWTEARRILARKKAV